MNRSEYLEMVEKLNQIKETTFKRLREIYNVAKESGILDAYQKALPEDMFGTKNQFTGAKSLTYPIYKILEAIFDLNARHRALRDFDFVISQDSVSFKIVADYETEYFHLDAIVAYGSDQDFKKYLSDFKKEMHAYVNYFKKLREDRKDNTGQETFLELKAKFEALPQGKVQEWIE